MKVAELFYYKCLQLKFVFEGISSVAHNNYVPCTGENTNYERSDKLKKIIRDYFESDYPKDITLNEDVMLLRKLFLKLTLYLTG